MAIVNVIDKYQDKKDQSKDLLPHETLKPWTWMLPTLVVASAH